jgi:adenylate cyclase
MDTTPLPATPSVAQALFGPSGRWSLEPVSTWLLTQGRHVTEPRAFLAALVEQLDAVHAGVDRIRISGSTLHPQLAALGISWSRGDNVQLWSGEHGVQLTDAYRGSPMEQLQQHRRMLHLRITEEPVADEHPIWQDLRSAGMRDYLALPMVLGAGRQNALTLATRDPAGFDDDDIARLTALANLLTPLVELMVGRRTTLGLLETFVGKRIGERILQGQVKRGDGEVISAAFWYSDLRGFTALSETLPTDQLLKLLNDYFEYCAAAAASRGGEILQFIGDAILIVFEITEPQRSRQVCAAALDAAIDAFDSIAVVNNRRRRSRQPVIEFGLGLHLGTVTHANVGAPDRLAFNVIGPAVNMTARIQSLTKELQIPLLMSSDFVRQVDNPVISVGHHAMRGIGHSQELFRLRPE